MARTIEEERRIDRNSPDYEAECAGHNCIGLVNDEDKNLCGSCRSRVAEENATPVYEKERFPYGLNKHVINALVNRDDDTGELIRGPRTVSVIVAGIKNTEPDRYDPNESSVETVLLNMERYGLTSRVDPPGVGTVSWTYTGPEEHVTR